MRMMAMFTSTARGDRNTLESMATPCSVKAVKVSLDGLVAITGCLSIKLGQIRIENDLLVAEHMNERGDLFRDENSGFLGRLGFPFRRHGVI